LHEGADLLRATSRAAIVDQENLACGALDEALQEFDENSNVDAALSMIMNRTWPRAVTAEIRLMPWREPVAGTMGVTPFVPRVMIGPDVRRVAEIDVRPLLLNHRLDLRVFRAGSVCLNSRLGAANTKGYED
jgi:hypothetical protein